MCEVMVCLVGEQPVPNLLPIKHLKPGIVVLVHSDRTRSVSENLQRFLREDKEWSGKVTVEPLFLAEAFRIDSIHTSLREFFTSDNWSRREVLFNITGGTKPMCIAAFLVAQELGCPVVYLESQRANTLYYYRSANGALAFDKEEIIHAALRIDEYLKIHGHWQYQVKGPQDDFEREIKAVLQEKGLDVLCSVNLGSLEMDAVVGMGSSVGVIQAKTGKAARRIDGIYNLNTAAQNEFFGSHTKKILVLSQPPETNICRLAEQQKIEIIVLPSFEELGRLSDEDKRILAQGVTRILSRK